MTDIPHFDFPFQRDPATGKVAVVEQGQAQHVRAQEYAVIVTPLGYRHARPDFGWTWPEFQSTPLDLNPLRDALTRLVPDSNADITQWMDEITAATHHVLIREKATMLMPFHEED